jgi:hypothetical protein
MIRLRHVVAFVVAAASCQAQPTLGQGLETAARDAQRYFDCIDSLDESCLSALMYTSPFICNGFIVPGTLVRLRADTAVPRRLGNFDRVYWHLETTVPDAIASDDERLYVLVPFRLALRVNQWIDRPGFLLGVSEDDGESWRFLDDAVVWKQGIDQIIPGYAGPPLPDAPAEPALDPQPTESQYLITREAGFIPGTREGDAYAELTFEVRDRIREPVRLFLAFENPQASAAPIVAESLLMPRQETFSLTSPLITGLRAGDYYEVAVFGLDSDTEEVVFEHRQMLHYFPVSDFYEEVLPAIAGPPIQAVSSLYSGVGQRTRPIVGDLNFPVSPVAGTVPSSILASNIDSSATSCVR